MTDRHEAALRAALAERDRLRGREPTFILLAGDTTVARIVEAALAAADAPLTAEQRKAIAKRFGMGWSDGAYVVCDRYYPKCCSYHEGFDDALAEMPVLSAADAHDGAQIPNDIFFTLAEHFAECPAPPDGGCSACHSYEQERRRRCHGSIESCIRQRCGR